MSIKCNEKIVVDLFDQRHLKKFTSDSGCNVYEVWMTDYEGHVKGLRSTSQVGRYFNTLLRLGGQRCGTDFRIKTGENGVILLTCARCRIIRVKDKFDDTISESKMDKDTSITLELDHEMIIDPKNKVLRDGALVVEVHEKGYSCGGFNDPFVPKNKFNQNMLTLLEDEESADISFKIKGSCNYQYESDDTEINRLNVRALFGKADEGYDDDTADTSVTIYAHMLVLKVCAPLLASLCEGYTKSSPVSINNAEPSVFRYMIRYVYGGKIPPSELRKRPGVFIEIADRYSIKDLKMEAEAWYIKSDLITAENLVDVFTFADSMNCPLLMEKAADYFLNEPETILKSSSFNFADAYETALRNGPDLLVEVANCFFTKYGEKIMPLCGKRIAKSYKMSHALLSNYAEALSNHITPNEWEVASLRGLSLDSMRRRLYYKGLEVEGSREVLVKRLDSKVPDWKKNGE